jgi:hypothetical protein
MVKWSSKGPEGALLISLLNSQTVDPSCLDKKYILQVKEAYPEFSKFSDDRFIINYKKLVREFSVHKSIQGVRKSSHNEDDDFDDEDEYDDEEEEDEEAIEEKVSHKPPSTLKMKNSPVRNLESKMSAVSIGSGGGAGGSGGGGGPTKLQLGHVMYQWPHEDGSDCVSIHIECPSSTQADGFVAKVTNGTNLQIEFKMAEILLSPNWLQYVEGENRPSVLNAYKKECTRMIDMKATTGFFNVKLPFAVDIAPIDQAKIAGMRSGRDTITKVLSLSYRCIHRSVHLSTASVIQMYDVENMHRRQYASPASSSAATAASSLGNLKDPEDDGGRSSKKRGCSTLTEMTDL